MQWHELELLIESLEDQYPDVEIDELTTSDLFDLILDLPEFSDDPDEAKDSSLKRILEAWSYHRTDKQ